MEKLAPAGACMDGCAHLPESIVFTENLNNNAGRAPVWRVQIIRPLDTKRHAVVERGFGLGINKLQRRGGKSGRARHRIALRWIGSCRKFQNVWKSIEVEVVRVCAVAGVVDTAEVLQSPRFQVCDSRTGESDIEWIPGGIVAGNVQCRAARAQSRWRELNCEVRACARRERTARRRCKDKFARIGPSTVMASPVRLDTPVF